MSDENTLLKLCQLNVYMLFILFCLLVHFVLSICSPRSEGSVLVAYRAVQERWTHYSRSPEGGSIFWHLHSISCSGAQQQARAGHTGTESVHEELYEIFFSQLREILSDTWH